MPEVHVDYCFMGTNEDDKEKLLTILVAKERDSGMMMSTIVPQEGKYGRVRGQATQRIHKGNWMRVPFSDPEIGSRTCAAGIA